MEISLYWLMYQSFEVDHLIISFFLHPWSSRKYLKSDSVQYKISYKHFLAKSCGTLKPLESQAWGILAETSLSGAENLYALHFQFFYVFFVPKW